MSIDHEARQTRIDEIARNLVDQHPTIRSRGQALKRIQISWWLTDEIITIAYDALATMTQDELTAWDILPSFVDSDSTYLIDILRERRNAHHVALVILLIKSMFELSVAKTMKR